MNKVITILLCALSTVGLYAQHNYTDYQLEIIKNIPNEIDGGACYFSETISAQKEDKFVFVNDFALYGCIQINEEVLLLELKEYIDVENRFIYTLEDRNLIIEIVILGKETNDNIDYLKIELSVPKHFKKKILYGNCYD
ncbi:MAG: hypothetical protein J6V54_06255 [Bacteroidales bacterium]|nr:hypothetical protein [Bacteroidales bacterium]